VNGTNPAGSLVKDSGNALYGTTITGGAKNKGVVFRLLPPANSQTLWSHSVLYSFRGGALDGANPYSKLVIGTNRLLYGTASAGNGGSCTGGCGSVFKITY
jgi:uncharacterized repeat protein (TIGR03803 family)